MRCTFVKMDGVTAEIQGGWAASHRPDAMSTNLIPIRLDSGRCAEIAPRPDIEYGDRIYRVLYRGHAIVDHVGTDIHDVTTDAIHQDCHPAVRRRSSIFPVMAAIPAFMAAVMMAAWLSGVRSAAMALALVTVIAPLTMALVVGALDARSVAMHNRRCRQRLKICRDRVGAVIDEDVATWKAALLERPYPSHSFRTAIVRGMSCNVVQGTMSSCGRMLVLTGFSRSVSVPVEAHEFCKDVAGQEIHALMPGGSVPPCPIAISEPVSGAIWLDPHVMGGIDGRPYRQAVKALMGRIAWQGVTRQWDEVGRRRQMTTNR